MIVRNSVGGVNRKSVSDARNYLPLDHPNPAAVRKSIEALLRETLPRKAFDHGGSGLDDAIEVFYASAEPSAVELFDIKMMRLLRKLMRLPASPSAEEHEPKRRPDLQTANKQLRPHPPKNPPPSLPPLTTPVPVVATIKARELQAPKPRIKTRPSNAASLSAPSDWRWQQRYSGEGR